ncbi:RimJ/RimL family protein N-acetyltransferase [Rhodovulum imhoffii]|uniref:RimJ/RimL family protein N-acetyltransferase n=1 Tax=Rhodovulum imhoffii TaxID=365340 RepID=A0A2T5BP60_9RHOB|nr:GNAT family protein [Rhodovulum imhoffii]MBK5933968.1 hypothetical protein [Rhodovulum imhoffii]PTN00801.1 RimJ/RimL family protein N-acetyltransferase [Rhodovulum imhoffii]
MTDDAVDKSPLPGGGPAAPALHRPKRIEIETERFLIRGVRTTDIDQTWVDWAADREAMLMYNQKIDPEIAHAHFVRMALDVNGVRTFMPGIFDKSGTPIGYFLISRRPGAGVASFEYFLGDRAWWGKNVILETRAALLDYFFETHDLVKAMGYPFARNFASVFNYKAQGWIQEGTLMSHTVSVADPDTRLDMLVFRLFKEEWDEIRNTRTTAS